MWIFVKNDCSGGKMMSSNCQKLSEFEFFVTIALNLISTRALFMKKHHFALFGLYSKERHGAPAQNKKLQHYFFLMSQRNLQPILSSQS
jgi:hypothetical protein